jgi:hypothetical protein
MYDRRIKFAALAILLCSASFAQSDDVDKLKAPASVVFADNPGCIDRGIGGQTFHRFVSQFSRLFFFSDNLILSCPN